jgi:hypothetical protein
MPEGDGEGGAGEAPDATEWLTSAAGRSCVRDALADHRIPAAWAPDVIALLQAMAQPAGDDARVAQVHATCARLLEGTGGRAVLLALDETSAPASAPPATDDDPLDGARRRVCAISRGADWMASAALAALALRVTPPGPAAPHLPAGEVGPIQPAALWYAGRRDCFAEDGASALTGEAAERRARAVEEVAAVLRAAGAPEPPTTPSPDAPSPDAPSPDAPSDTPPGSANGARS